MRIEISCGQCSEGKPSRVRWERIEVPIADSNLYHQKCSQGHDFTVLLQNHRHEILAENAVWAIADGYNREGVASFAAALERFYEYYFEAVTRAHKIERSEFADTWKLVKNQSERQFGLYLAAYLFENKALAPTLETSGSGAANVAFRNKVIHKGHIPSKAEATEFGQAVVDLIHKVMSTATAKLQTAISDLKGERISADLSPLSDDERGKASHHWIQTVLSSADPDSGETNVAQVIELRRQVRDHNRQISLNNAIDLKWSRAERHFDAQHEMLAARRDRGES